MLSDLQVKNFALIDQSTINFKSGLNVLTGETGAGKSIIIGALDMLLGARASTDVIRTGKNSAYISAFFQPDQLDIINNTIDEAGIETEKNGVLIAREIKANGRNRTLINGQLATLRLVKNISRYLLDIHGQHEHQLLLDQKFHLMILDEFIGEKIKVLKNEIKEIYQEYQLTVEKLSNMELDDSQRVRELDLINFQIEEIESAQLKEGEYEVLKEKYNTLSHAEEIFKITGNLISVLTGDDYSDGGIVEKLGILKNELEDAADFDKRLKNLEERFADIFFNLEDFSFKIQDYHDTFDYDKEELTAITKRMDLINRLLRKYGSSTAEIKEYLDELYEKKDHLENIEEKIAKLKKEKNSLKKNLINKAEKLSVIRKDRAAVFEKRLKEELSDLAMENAKFKVIFTKKNPGIDGIDRVEFLISPNPGEDLKALTKIVSGGELSRIMLALKTITANLDQVDTLVFDEVDSGVGGKIAVKMAEKLFNISLKRQIICITHLPQIASMGNHHFLISKKTEKNRTFTNIDILDREARTRELARMLGTGELTEKAAANAGEMLNLAFRKKESLLAAFKN
ncbi:MULTISPECIES: DNA repair protein RecN [unclassified Halanaerobium]|uniref:DNA repair protein RecN n=1 Tax=unclassified Halanaerobium TaxID=2641197 RepID=UPI000DF14F0C|nr:MULTISPECIES: DNA repair protein RecN [unclassified Halanaerobium]RCW50555.1 DNA replication and repair protein RecN [Halanaerobium sp. MA284_MarDTE_T2]RCW82177.1 DNA replication and repair protein RecN [Halanaerobium sp. DL-01]